MAIAAATVSATGGITGKVCLGTIIGSALGFVAGNMSKSDSAIGRRFGDHLNRMAKDFMADEGLDIDLFKDIDESYKPNNNYIDYKTSRRQFQSNQEDFKYEDALMVGDRKYDKTGADGLGIKCVLIEYGFGSREELEKCEPFSIQSTVSDLQKFLDSLIKRG